MYLALLAGQRVAKQVVDGANVKLRSRSIGLHRNVKYPKGHRQGKMESRETKGVNGRKLRDAMRQTRSNLSCKLNGQTDD